MIAARIIIAGALLATGWAVYAKPVARPVSPSPQDLVLARQAGMAMSASTMNLLRGASTNGAPLKSLAFPASGLAKWAAAAPALFAESTKGVLSRGHGGPLGQTAGREGQALQRGAIGAGTAQQVHRRGRHCHAGLPRQDQVLRAGRNRPG
ncbi:MAG: hypothetical protein ACKOPM_00320, partial [Novosphingobium sp.]